jgi:hypothetical protein
MDLSNPKVWSDGIGTLVSAPHIIVPLLILVAGSVWWLRGTIEQASKEGLNSQIGALNARLQLAKDQEADVSKKLESAKSEMADLQRKTAGTLDKVAAKASASVATAIGSANAASRRLHNILGLSLSTVAWGEFDPHNGLVDGVGVSSATDSGVGHVRFALSEPQSDYQVSVQVTTKGYYDIVDQTPPVSLLRHGRKLVRMPTRPTCRSSFMFSDWSSGPRGLRSRAHMSALG